MMRNYIWKFSFIALFVMASTNIIAQTENSTTDKKVNIKVAQTEAGKTVNIDTSFTVTDKVDIQAIFKKLGIDLQLEELASDEQLEVIVKRSKDELVVNDLNFQVRNLTPYQKLSVAENAFLGVTVITSNSAGGEQIAAEGARITTIISGTGAESAGLKPNDVIIQVDESKVNNYNDLLKTIRSHKPGDKVEVFYIRDGEVVTSNATLGKNVRGNAMGENMKFYFKNGESLNGNEMIRINVNEIQNIKGLNKEELENLKEFSQEQMAKKGEALKYIRVLIKVEDINEAEANKLNTAVENTLAVEGLMIAPNPGNGLFNVSFTLPEAGKTNLRIFDISGKEVYSEVINDFGRNYNNNIDMSSYPKGIYFLQVSQNEKVLNQKLVIQ